MGLFFSSKKPVISEGSSAKTSHGSVSNKEFKSVHHELINKLGRNKGGRISELLHSHLDRDAGASFRGISRGEADEALKRMQSNYSDGIDHNDIQEVNDILDKHI